MKLFKLVISTAGALELLTSAMAQNIVSPSGTEIDRFLDSSGMKMVVVNGHKMAVSRALRQGQLTKASADCFRSDEVVATYIEQVLRPLIAKNVNNPEDLKAANSFNETTTGIKIARYIKSAQNAALDSFDRGENLPPLTPMQLSQQEKEEVGRWEASSHFVAIRQFEAVLRNMRATQEYQLWLASNRAKCSEK